jgi:GT2 family glycosyltransferase
VSESDAGPEPITAVIPCRNAAAFLTDTLASVRAQSRAVTEVIVVDDASTDGSAELAERLGATVIRHDRQRGNGAARNTGLRAARTELIALLDADDLWLPTHVASVGGLLERHPEAAVAFSALRLIGEGVGSHTPLHTPRLPDGTPLPAFLHCIRHDVGQPSACVLRRSAALSVGGFDETMALGVDFDMHLRLSARFLFVATWEVTALYRAHGGQISTNKSGRVPWCFRARERAWRALVDAGDLEGAADAARIIREAWEGALQAAWDVQNRRDLDMLLGLAPLVPDGTIQHRRWSRRAAVPRPLLAFWGLAGDWVRRPARWLLHRLEGEAP